MIIGSGLFRSSSGAAVAYRTAGQGGWLVLCHALASSKDFWQAQVDALASRFSVLTYDLRGHGESPVPPDGDYRFESQAADLVALLDHLGVSEAGLVGVSVGGEVAQVAAALYPRRFTHLLLCSTACYTDAARSQTWEQRIEQATTLGMPAIAPKTVTRWFSPEFATCFPLQVQACLARVAGTPLASYVGVARVIQAMDLRPLIRLIECPTLLVCGGLDTNTGPAAAAQIAGEIRHARVAVIEKAGHFPSLEAPHEFTRLLETLVQRQASHASHPDKTSNNR